MKKFSVQVSTYFFIVFLFTVVIVATSIRVAAPQLHPTLNGEGDDKFGGQKNVHHDESGGVTEDLGTEFYPTGSSLPDCSHACGPCFPCKRVMVSFKCSIAESCPIVYRCMCKGKYYHVPSNY